MSEPSFTVKSYGRVYASTRGEGDTINGIPLSRYELTDDGYVLKADTSLYRVAPGPRPWWKRLLRGRVPSGDIITTDDWDGRAEEALGEEMVRALRDPAEWWAISRERELRVRACKRAMAAGTFG